MTERKYSIYEVAEEYALHPYTVQRLFLDEPGVIRMGRPQRFVWKNGRRRKKRQYYSLRIPASVVERVFRRMTVRVGG